MANAKSSNLFQFFLELKKLAKRFSMSDKDAQEFAQKSVKLAKKNFKK